MDTENIKKESLSQLGLPPMELAESTNNDRNNNGMISKCFLRALKILLLLTIFGAGTYLLDSIFNTRVFGNYESPKNTQIILINKNGDPPNLFHIIRLLNTTPPEREIVRKKRDIVSEEHDSFDRDDLNFLNFNDDLLQKARETIMKYDVMCNEENKQEICKDLVTKLKIIANSDQKKAEKPKINNNNDNQRSEISSTEVAKREVLPVVHLDEIIESVPRPYTQKVYPQTHSDPNNCLLTLLRKYSQRKEPLDPTFEYLAPPEVHHNHLSLPEGRYFSSPHNSHVRDAEGHKKIHPQDVDIIMSFLTPTTELKASERQVNSTRDVSCPEGTVPCMSGPNCIEKKRWCDGNVDCTDVSDEAKCSCKSRVDKARLCDGYFDCPFGEDEMGCNGCSDSTFSCEDTDKNSRSTCFTKEQRCNNIVECPNHRDEVECNMLAPSLVKKPIFAISNTEGFLHRNFKGEWYAVCKNPYMWAHDVCRRESGLIIRPPFIQIVPIDPMLKINYINTDPGGLVQTSDTCLNSSAVYITCPDMLCGTRVPSTSQLLRENAAIENHLFGRNKRFLKSKHQNFPLMFYGNRWKRNIDNANITTDPGSKFNAPKTEDSFNGIRNKRTESRVVGGKPSQPAAWPWVVAIYRNGMFHCGGVIVTHSWVISAAHCVHKFWDHYYEVQVGMLRRFSFSPQESNYKVTHIIVNQHYSQSDMKNDLSLLKVAPAMQFSRWVRPICLPSPETAGEDWLWGPAPGTMCTAVGWGATVEHGPDPDHLREVDVPIWNSCKHSEDRAGREICAGLVEGGKDACQGDSGGPLLCKNPLNTQQWYMVGIVSHGDGCGRKGEPGVYTRVSLFVKWIRFHTSSNSLPIIQPIQECPGFKCESGISKCLPNIRKCDEIIDCLDGEDEINCKYNKSTLTLLENTISPKIELVEEIFATKEAKSDLQNAFNTNTTPSEDINRSTDESEIITSTPYSGDKLSKNDIDFQHASTVDISIIKTSEDFSKSLEFSVAVESTTTDSSVDESLSETRGDLKSITMDFEKKSLESRSSVLGKIRQGTTEKDSTEGFEQLEIETSTVFVTKNNQTDIMDTTTHEKIDKSNELNLLTTIRSIENQHDSGVDKKSDDFSIELLPDSHLSVPDKINSTDMRINNGNLTSNKTHDKEEAIKQLPDFDDESVLINKIEDIVSGELQPATVRRKHRIPKEFQCRRIYQIISYHHRCDRKADCEDGTDELDCSCTDYLTTFDDKLICDGIFDCADGHDESDCFSCGEDQFLCKQSQMCLPVKNVCDGKPQCPESEDELDCFALSNGKEIYYDVDERPVINLEGYLTKKSFNNWHVVCDDKLTLEQQEMAATHICRYLGFGAANKFYVKYINVKEDEIAERSLRNRRNTLGRIPIHFLYRQQNVNNSTERQVVLKEAQVLKENCVPNITKTCKSLYVFCDHSLFTNFEESDNIFLRKAETTSKHTWPWAAKVFVEGEYRCTGVLVNLSWVLVSESCLWDSTLAHHYVSVVLGSHRTLEAMNGMYEQAYQVDAKKDIYNSKVILLHLKQPAIYSNFVKPMIVSSSFTRLDPKSTCVAIGQDDKNKTISISLEETNENCNPSNRCFIRRSNESICPVNISHNRHWAGIISCHTDQGWFPTASFVDSRGECRLEDRINATDIDNLKNEINRLHGIKSPSTLVDIGNGDDCEGIRCGRGRCISLVNVCDGVRSCEDGKDESESACEKKIAICGKDPYHTGCECSVGQMKCRNGKCIPKELFRDGNNDCGDRTDEPDQSTCSQYLARVMPSRLCDGILHCHDRSDEDPMFCKCFAKKSHPCGTKSNGNHCVPLDMVCDEVQDCPNGEDEKICIGLNSVAGTPRGTGQVVKRSHGVWYSKCYTKQNHTKFELEAICAELGFISGHAKQIHRTDNFKLHEHNNLVIDPFIDITFNNNTVIKMRNTHNPIATGIIDNQLANCYPLFIECH